MNIFHQEIVNVQQSTAQVKSAKGNIYPVVIADRLRLSRKPINIGDTGVIHRVNGRYYLYDVIPKVDETKSYLAEVPLTDLIGDY